MMKSLESLIYDLDHDTLEEWFESQGEPAFRADQVWVAIYKYLKFKPQAITTLPLDLRERLSSQFDFQGLAPVRTVESEDGHTVKTLFQLRDGYYIETVLMDYEERHTICVSSQSGCGLGCSFCATGQMGFSRNLSSGEIIEQVLYFARNLAEKDESVTNIVMMGMGEPFQNYENLMAALDRLNDPRGFGIGARRITISTVGLVPKIKQFADENTQYNLAISLHTVDNELRSKMMPINKKYPVETLLEACQYYVEKTNRRLTFEYALIDGVNDHVSDAAALARKIKHLLCHVNLIPLNPTRGFAKQGTGANQAKAFCEMLERNNIPCTVRLRRGIDIQAGCGQLATETDAQVKNHT